MTVNVPQNDRGAGAIAAEIAVLSARTDQYSVQKLNQRQTELVSSLLDQQHLSAATIIAGYTGPQSNALFAKIAASQARITAYGASMPGADESANLAALQTQLVSELMSSGQLTAASILSSQTYSGGARS